jgi:hypothetical protein
LHRFKLAQNLHMIKASFSPVLLLTQLLSENSICWQLNSDQNANSAARLSVLLGGLTKKWHFVTSATQMDSTHLKWTTFTRSQFLKSFGKNTKTKSQLKTKISFKNHQNLVLKISKSYNIWLFNLALTGRK